MAIVTRPATKEYRDNWSETFGKKDESDVEEDGDETLSSTEEEPKEQTE